ncbi:hypothetical protein TWF281_005440 [Arthrobotrys megalospora]
MSIPRDKLGCRTLSVKPSFGSRTQISSTQQLFANLILLIGFLNLVLHVGSTPVEPTSQVSNLSTSLSTSSAFPSLIPTTNTTTPTIDTNSTYTRHNSNPTAAKHDEDAIAPNAAAVETSKVEAREITPSFFYSGEMSIRCNDRAWVYDRLIVPLLQNPGQPPMAPFSQADWTKVTKVIRTNYRKLAGTPDERKDMMEVLGRWQAYCTNTCSCDPETGKLIAPPPRVGAGAAGAAGNCLQDYQAMRCSVLFGCWCWAQLGQPDSSGLDSFFLFEDFQHAINGIPQTVVNANPGWGWRVPAEFAEYPNQILRPGDPAVPRTNLAAPGEPPYWFYDPMVLPEMRNQRMRDRDPDRDNAINAGIAGILYKFINFGQGNSGDRGSGFKKRDLPSEGGHTQDAQTADTHKQNTEGGLVTV